MTEPHQHCENERICYLYRDSQIAIKRNRVCRIAPCNSDTRAAKAERNIAETDDNILAVLKNRYRKEMAILDYVEMIECEIRALRSNQQEQP
jgi:hypothetical protein